MFEYSFSLDDTFGALADQTRRDILRRVSSAELSIGEIAKNYNLTFAAVSKHLMVLEKSRLIIKRREGRKHYVRAQAGALKEANDYLEWYRGLWEGRLDALEQYLIENKE